MHENWDGTKMSWGGGGGYFLPVLIGRFFRIILDNKIFDSPFWKLKCTGNYLFFLWKFKFWHTTFPIFSSFNASFLNCFFYILWNEKHGMFWKKYCLQEKLAPRTYLEIYFSLVVVNALNTLLCHKQD